MLRDKRINCGRKRNIEVTCSCEVRHPNEETGGIKMKVFKTGLCVVAAGCLVVQGVGAEPRLVVSGVVTDTRARLCSR